MSEQVPTGSEEELREQDVMEVLRHVYDPELQMDIVELGLVYGVELLPEGRIKVNMTLTSPGHADDDARREGRRGGGRLGAPVGTREDERGGEAGSGI
jgi:hypothetical protein